MYYKLTDWSMQTYQGFQWELGKWYRIPDDSRRWDSGLCSSGWFHCYDDPLIAMFRNPGDANIHSPRLFRVTVRGNKETDHGLKYGFTMMRLKEEIDVPDITNEQRVKFGILCAMQAYKEQRWTRWAENWLDGTDRSYQQARKVSDRMSTANVGLAAYCAAIAAKCFGDPNFAGTIIAYGTARASYYAARCGDIDLRSLARQAMK